MKKLTQILGLVGLVAIGVGFFALMVGRKFNLFIELHLLLGIVLALFGLFANLGALREYFFKHSGKAQTEAGVLILGLLVAIFLTGGIVYQHNWLYDLTGNRLFTLSPRTIEILARIPGPISITAFLPTEGADDTKQLLKLFGEKDEKLKIETIDPDRHPELAEARSVGDYGTVIFEYQGREARAYDVSEEDIINSLVRVTRETSPVIYFLAGHGEADPEAQDKGGLSMIKGFLDHENFQIRKLQLTPEGVPEDARMIVIAGPRGPYQNWEVAQIDRYLGKGGDAILMLDPFVFTNFEQMIFGYGLELSPGIVVDQENYMAGMDAMGLSPVTSRFGGHESTAQLQGKLVVFPRARPLRITPQAELSGSWAPLAVTADSAWVETDAEGFYKYGRVRRTADKPSGPLIIAAAYNEKLQLKPWQTKAGDAPRETRLIVTGNSFFMRNLALEVYSNYQLAINIFNWVAGEHDYIFLAPKKRSASRIWLTEKQINLIFYSSVLVIPELICILGLAVWWRRK